MPFTPGQVVGDYRILDVIGAGGMGTVYKVQHLISERVEALKLVLPNLLETPELADRFVREIKVQARLSHPNIAALHNAFRFENQLLMVMEYVDGETLGARLTRGPMTPPTSVEVMLQVLAALSYAHGQRIIHRDVKPANIMFTAAGIVKVMDFGIARATAETQLTYPGAAVGSVSYMSPEQVQGTPVDGRSDLYSAGVVLYEMATGTKPITGDSSWAIMNAHIHVIPKAPVLLNNQIPSALSLAILKALNKNPDHRYVSAAEFAGILTAIKAGETEGTLRKLVQPKQTTQQKAVSLQSADVERVQRELATYLGPMARIVVNQAARQASTLKQLYEIVSRELPEGPERKKFLAGSSRGT